MAAGVTVRLAESANLSRKITFSPSAALRGTSAVRIRYRDWPQSAGNLPAANDEPLRKGNLCIRISALPPVLAGVDWQSFRRVDGHHAIARQHRVSGISVVKPQPGSHQRDPCPPLSCELAGQCLQPKNLAAAEGSPRNRFPIGIYSSSGCTICGASLSSRVRSASDSRTRSNSPYSRYRSPPWINREEYAVAPDAKSATSTSTIGTRFNSSSRAIAGPVYSGAENQDRLPLTERHWLLSFDCCSVEPSAVF